MHFQFYNSILTFASIWAIIKFNQVLEIVIPLIQRWVIVLKISRLRLRLRLSSHKIIRLRLRLRLTPENEKSITITILLIDYVID